MYALNVKSFRSKTVTETKCRSLALISNSKIRLIEHGLKNVPRAYSVKKLYKFYKKVKFEEKSHKSSRSYGIQANEMIYRNVNAILFSNISRKRNNLTRLSCLHSTFWKIPSQHLRHYNDGLKKFTEISNDHLTPELSLHLITPNCEIWHSPATKFHFDNDPFWAIYWPGGQALSRYILDQRQLFQGKNVIDIGSGCGASAIAAAKSGARTVLANDIDNLSMQAIAMNAELNQVELYLENSDVIGKDVDSINVVVNGQIVQPRWDIVLVGDMFYDSEFTNKLFLWLNELNSNGKTVLIGDPGRHAFKHIMGREKLVKLASYPGNQKEHFGFDSYSVWKIS